MAASEAAEDAQSKDEVRDPGETKAPANAFAAVEAHEHKKGIVALARAVFSAMAADRKTAPDRSSAEAKAKELELERDACATPFGNAADVLFRGPEDDAERELAGALVAHVASLGDPSDDGAVKQAEEIVWLAAHTPFDGLAWLDELPPKKRPWRAVADAAKGKVLDRAEKLVACAALARADGEIAKKALATMDDDDPLVAAIVRTRQTGGPEKVEGRVGPSPRRPWVTVILGLTGILFVIGIGRLIGRWVLGYKTPAEVAIAGDAVTVKWKTILLGRTLRDREVVMPREGLVLAAREVRFPSLHLYAGLVALAIGSYFGMSLVVDGFRAWSSSLLGVGLLAVLAGIALDFAFASIIPGTQGKCRVVLRPRRGAILSIEDVDPKRADAALARLK